MKIKNNLWNALLNRLQLNLRPAPSLRMPVTEHNRILLRRMREAELSAWQEADRKPLKPVRIQLREFTREPLFRVNITHR